MDLFEYVGQRIRELRSHFSGGKGISQEELAKGIGVTPNTISRWETATYRPALDDLDNLARFFGVTILEFFPPDPTASDERVSALLRTAKQLAPEDLVELQRFAEFRRARQLYQRSKRSPTARKRG